MDEGVIVPVFDLQLPGGEQQRLLQRGAVLTAHDGMLALGEGGDG